MTTAPCDITNIVPEQSPLWLPVYLSTPVEQKGDERSRLKKSSRGKKYNNKTKRGMLTVDATKVWEEKEEGFSTAVKDSAGVC